MPSWLPIERSAISDPPQNFGILFRSITPHSLESSTDLLLSLATPGLQVTMSSVPVLVSGLDFTKTFKPMGQVAVISRSDREALSPTEREKLRINVVTPLKPEFRTDAELIKQNNQGNSFLINSLDFQKQVKNLKARLASYNMEEVFMMYEVNPTTMFPSGPTSLNLLDNYSTITLEQVMLNSKMSSGFGDQVTIENLHWSKALILGSCDLELRSKIETQMAMLSPSQDTGPVAFHYLATYVVSTSDSVARSIVTKLSTMRLSQFAGEDVAEMAATVRGAAARLKSCNRLPNDMNDIVAEILDSASTFKFRAVFDTLSATNDPIMSDWEKMLDKATLIYQDLTLKGRWVPIRKKGASFIAAQLTQDDDDNRDPQINVIQGPDGQRPRTHDRKGNPIDRKAPAPGEATSRTSNGKTEHWCSKCDWNNGRWGNHPTDQHTDFVDKQRAFRKKQKEKKDLTATTAPTPPSPDPKKTTVRFSIPEANMAAVTSLSAIGTFAPF